MEIKETKDYGIFSFVNGNRKIDEKHKDRLKKSMAENDLANPIIVNGKLEIIDGQHRYVAKKELGLLVQYIVADNYSIDQVNILNSNSKNWKTLDFIKSYAKLGNENYKELLSIMEEYNEFTLEVILNVTQNENNNPAGKLFHQIKTGNLQIGYPDIIRKKIDTFRRFKNVTMYYKRAPFIKALIKLQKEKNGVFNIDTLYKKIETYPDRVYDCKSRDTAIAMIEDIYNRGASHKVNLRF